MKQPTPDQKSSSARGWPIVHEFQPEKKLQHPEKVICSSSDEERVQDDENSQVLGCWVERDLPAK